MKREFDIDIRNTEGKAERIIVSQEYAGYVDLIWSAFGLRGDLTVPYWVTWSEDMMAATRVKIAEIAKNPNELNLFKKAVDEAILGLPDRSREVLRLRYGLGEPEAYKRSYEQVGRSLSKPVTKERARELVRRAEKDLRILSSRMPIYSFSFPSYRRT